MTLLGYLLAHLFKKIEILRYGLPNEPAVNMAVIMHQTVPHPRNRMPINLRMRSLSLIAQVSDLLCHAEHAKQQ